MTKAITGGCACGAIHYEIAAEPIMALHCQCLNCQKATGTGHMTGGAFPKAAVKMTGKATEYSQPADSGATATSGFCGVCGSLIYGKTSGMPDMMIIHAGSLDEPSRIKPQMVAYAKRGHDWDHLDPTLPRFPEMPAM